MELRAESANNLPLVLLPGTLCDETLWSGVLAHDARLARRALPLPLEGISVGEAIARLEPRLPPRFAVAGFSLGAIVALELVSRFPARVAGLCLIAGNGRAVPPAQMPARRDALRLARLSGLETHVREHLWPLYVAPGASGDRAMFRQVVAMAERAGADRYGEQVEIAISRRDSVPALPGISQPALIVGGALDVINPPELQQELAAGLPGADLHMVRQAGHFVPLESPGELAAALLGWLRRVDGKAG